MKVLLVDPGKKYLEKENTVVKPYPHIGLCYLGSYLSSKNINVEILDVGVSNKNDEEIIEQIKNINPNIIAITAVTFLVPVIKKMCYEVKKRLPNVIIVVGGAHASAVSEDFLKECKEIDIAIRGEGEEVLFEIVKAYEEKRFLEKLKTIHGITYRENEEVILNPNQLPIKDLDKLPFLNWDLFDYSKYYKLYSKKFDKNISMFQVSGSRGCPYLCAFCYPLLGREVRYRSPENIVDEIIWIHKKFGARHIDFTDSTATVKKERFIKICDLLIEKELHNEIEWVFETRVDVIDREIFKKAKQAGADLVYFGLESGDDYILSKNQKNITVEMAEKAVKMAVEEGLKVKVSFILGHAFETETSARRTIEFAKKLKINYGIDMYFNIIDIYPNTQLFSDVDNNIGGTKWIEDTRNNWEKYNRAKPMIEVNDLDRYKIVEIFNEAQDMLREFSSEYTYKLKEVNSIE